MTKLLIKVIKNDRLIIYRFELFTPKSNNHKKENKYRRRT